MNQPLPRLLGVAPGWISSVLILSILLILSISAPAQSNITATLTFTNAAGTTNGDTITLGATTFRVTNSSVSLLYIAPTNSAARAATNFYNKLSNALTNVYTFAWTSPTNFTIRTVGTSLTLSKTGTWGILSLATNANGGTSLNLSNLFASKITFADGTTQTTAGGGGGGAPLAAGTGINVTTNGGTNVVALDPRVPIAATNLSLSLSPDSRSSQWEFASRQGLRFTDSGSNTVALVNGTNGLMTHATALVQLNGTNYVFATGRQGTGGGKLYRFEALNFSNVATLQFPDNGTHGNIQGGGADVLLYSPTNGKLYMPFNDQVASTNLVVAEIDPLTLAYSDVISNNTLSADNTNASGFSGRGAAVVGNKLFVGATGGKGANFFVFSLTNYALLYKTNVQVGLPQTYPGAIHSMHYDGRWLWMISDSQRPGALRVNPATYDLDVVAITNNTGEIYGVPPSGSGGIGFATDDATTFGNYLYIGTEDTNGVITRIHRDTLGVDRIRTGVGGNCWGTFAYGNFVYALFGATYNDLSNGIVCRIDPATLRVDQIRAPSQVNEMLYDGANYYFTTYSATTNNSLLARVPALEFSANDYVISSTNGSLRMSVDRSGNINKDAAVQSTYYGNGAGITNLSLIALPSAALTNGTASAVLGGVGFNLNTNVVYATNAGQALINATYTFHAPTGSYTNTATRYLTNVGGWWQIYNAGTIRYTNSVQYEIAGTHWVIVNGAAPAPNTFFDALTTVPGTLEMSSGGTANIQTIYSVAQYASQIVGANFVTVTNTLTTSNLTVTGLATIPGVNTNDASQITSGTLSRPVSGNVTNVSAVHTNMATGTLLSASITNGTGGITNAGDYNQRSATTLRLDGVTLLMTNGTTLNTGTGSNYIRSPFAGYTGLSTVSASASSGVIYGTFGSVFEIARGDRVFGWQYDSSASGRMQAGGPLSMSGFAVTNASYIHATNFVLAYSQPTTNGMGFIGGSIGCNGTNWWTIQRDSGGVLTTNKLTLTTWP